MRLTSAVLMGVLINSAISASLLATLEASSPALPQAQTADKKALDDQLLEAVRAGDAEKTRALLQSGADANGSIGFGLPLVAAIDRNDATLARLLIEAGAKVNPCGDIVCPLKHAAEAGHVEMVRLLLSLGANVDGGGPGRSPLSAALVMNRPEVARTLIAAGADWKAEKAYAESRHRPDIVKALEKVLGPIPPPMTVEQVVNKLEAQWDSMDLGVEQQDKNNPRVPTSRRLRLNSAPDLRLTRRTHKLYCYGLALPLYLLFTNSPQGTSRLHPKRHLYLLLTLH